jgi:FkbM family methyltransferase
MSDIFDEEIRIWKALIPSCKVIFDVGCQDDNMFYEINSNAKIYLFDPNRYEKLLQCIEGNVEYYEIALGSEETILPFHYKYGSLLCRYEEPKFKDWHTLNKLVTVTRIDTFVKNKNIDYIDYLKIDTEGFDFEVIKGCGSFLDKIKYLQFEDWTTDGWEEQRYYKGEKTEDILDYFKGYNKYLMKGGMKNYLVTKENLDHLF